MEAPRPPPPNPQLGGCVESSHEPFLRLIERDGVQYLIHDVTGECAKLAGRQKLRFSAKGCGYVVSIDSENQNSQWANRLLR